jgi:hypothetical protein
VRLTRLSQVPDPLEALRRWAGAPLPSGRRRRVLRGSAPHPFLSQPMAEGEAERRALLPTAQEGAREQVRPWRHRSSRGITGAWLCGLACFGGRACKKRREVGG